MIAYTRGGHPPLVAAAEDAGVIETAEEEMLYKVFDFADKEAHEVMVPRPEVVGDLGRRCRPRRRSRAVLESPYTRYPVYRESLDEIVGILHVRDLFSALHDRGIAEVELAAAPAAGLHRARDEGSRRAARRVPARRTSTWRSSSTSTARRRGSSRSRTCSRRSSARSRTSSTCPDESVERVDETTIRIDGTFPIDDFNEQFGDDARARGLPHGRGLRLRPDSAARAEPGDEVVDRRAARSACSRSRARGSSGSRSSSCPRRDRPATKARRRRPARLDGRHRRLAAPAPRLRPLPRRHGGDRVRGRDVVRRDRLAGLRGPRQPARPRSRRARDVPPAAAARAPRRPPRRPLPAAHAARDRDRARRRRHARAARRHARTAPSETWPFFLLAFGTGVASAVGAPAVARADTVARAASRSSCGRWRTARSRSRPR